MLKLNALAISQWKRKIFDQTNDTPNNQNTTIPQQFFFVKKAEPPCETEFGAREKLKTMCRWKVKSVREKTSLLILRNILNLISGGVSNTILLLEWDIYIVFLSEYSAWKKSNFYPWKQLFY